MTPRIYDIAITAGVLLAAVGAGLQWGAPAGLMVAGGLVITLTVFAAAVGGSR